MRAYVAIYGTFAPAYVWRYRNLIIIIIIIIDYIFTCIRLFVCLSVC